MSGMFLNEAPRTCAKKIYVENILDSKLNV